jgi:hypothetical protein
MGASDSGGRQTAKAEKEFAGMARSYRWQQQRLRIRPRYCDCRSAPGARAIAAVVRPQRLRKKSRAWPAPTGGSNNASGYGRDIATVGAPHGRER